MSPARFPTHRELLDGWGATSPSAASVYPLAMRRDIAECLRDVPERGVIARGLGRAYGDAAQNAGGRVIDTTGLVDIDLDPDTGRVTASAGTSLDRLMQVLVPRGFFVPVTPGTRQVTVGGAIAADIHGKNHHTKGTWCQHVVAIDLLLPTGEQVTVTPESDAELFWATAGGMGLTGIITAATFDCPAIESSLLAVDTFRARNLDALLAMLADDDGWEYSVAWFDPMATGRSLGRSVLTAGRFARVDELDRSQADDPLGFRSGTLLSAPPLLPSGLINRFSVRAFNELWYRKAPEQRLGELQTITQFFHPLDLVALWNRVYGPAGFLQWQPVVPLEATDTLREIIERLAAARCTSFLAVLKRFGAANPGMLSFPMPGWTLSIDIPCGIAGLGQLLDELDVLVADVGGRVYLAKDSRLAPEMLPQMYPRLGEFEAVRDRVDPERVLCSDLGRRLGLC